MNLLKIRKAIFATILFFAITHLIILGIQSIGFGSLAPLNIYTILGISELVPESFTVGAMANLYSAIFMAAVFVIAYLLVNRNK